MNSGYKYPNLIIVIALSIFLPSFAANSELRKLILYI